MKYVRISCWGNVIFLIVSLWKAEMLNDTYMKDLFMIVGNLLDGTPLPNYM